MPAKKTIVLVKDSPRKEAIASGVFSPGHLVQYDSAGSVLKHSTEGGFASALFATEQAYGIAANGVAPSVDTAYAVGDLAFLFTARNGDVVSAFVKPGTNYTVGTQLISGGDGTLESIATMTGGQANARQVIGTVETALDLSAGGSVATRTNVRIW